MNEEMKALSAGTIGGMSPPVFILAVQWAIERENIFPEATFWLGVLLLALIGLAIVWVFNETDSKKAFFVGLGIPALMNGVVAELTPREPDAVQNVREDARVFLFSPVYAAPGVLEKVILVDAEVRPITAVVVDSDNEVLEAHFIKDSKIPTKVTLSEQAKKVAFQSPDYNNIEVSVSNLTDGNSYRITATNQRFSGFFQALGARSVKRQSLGISNLGLTQPNQKVLATMKQVIPFAEKIEIADCKQCETRLRAAKDEIKELMLINEDLKSDLHEVQLKLASMSAGKDLPDQTDDRIFFDSGSATPRGQWKATLDSWRNLIVERGLTVTLVGHTDADGSDEYNEALSKRRVEFVRSQLVELGVPSTNIRQIAFGESVPAKENRIPTYKALNRRVVLVPE